ncbi:cell division protein ZapA [Tenacibaculum sp. 190524A02b]|uniref:Cell division protein ZapA n=1 Tax=Tenacibaculum vairaonense TaxID=3137860 RepID=A0ABM9PPI4_9FLAO
MTKLKVNVVIAGRTYPLTVKDTKEEEGLRKAAKDINKLIAKFEESYAVADKQDVLAMCALQFASKVALMSMNKEEEDTEVLEKIQSLTEMLDAHL